MTTYYKKHWENFLNERTTELQEEIKTLRAENALLKDQVKFGVDCFNALNEANARYREALEWYATEYLKTDEECDADISEIDECFETGNIAREALRVDITPEKGG